MYDLKTLTSLRILLKSNKQIGTARSEGYEIVPYTQYRAKILFPDQPLLKPPKSSIVDNEFIESLRPYQKEDLEIFLNRKSSANLSEPRTGKTPTAIRLFKAKGLKKILIIAPAAALYQWKDEFKKWFKENAEVLTSSITMQKRLELIDKWGADHTALIISYDSLKLVTRNGKQTGLLTHIINKKDIDGIIVDEVHRIRNHKSLQAKAVFKLSFIPNKHVLTGTPAHGRLWDVYSMLHFLYPMVFSSYWRFIDYYFNSEDVYHGFNEKHREITSLKNQNELPEFLHRIAVQHKRKDIMKWLPDKDYQEIKLPLTKEQKKYIEELEEDFETGDVIVPNVLTQLIRVRQICNAPELLNLKGKSPKLQWIKEWIEDNPDTPTLFFSNFTQFIELTPIENQITGRTPSKTRERIRKDFQEGKINQLIINIQAGKEALTLDRAQVAVFLDIYPPYGDIDQAENRFTATTEKLKDKPHTIIQLMMADSYDEKLFELVHARASETDIINSYKAHIERRTNDKTK